jgi:hypothetical protein
VPLDLSCVFKLRFLHMIFELWRTRKATDPCDPANAMTIHPNIKTETAAREALFDELRNKKRFTGRTCAAATKRACGRPVPIAGHQPHHPVSIPSCSTDPSCFLPAPEDQRSSARPSRSPSPPPLAYKYPSLGTLLLSSATSSAPPSSPGPAFALLFSSSAPS